MIVLWRIVAGEIEEIEKLLVYMKAAKEQTEQSLKRSMKPIKEQYD